ncbi:helix-turn-helix domain-containing protein [Ruegeria atlantica]|uniref:L-rhamnose operon regulatory protein RhaS n=1 Tax=Ruegeria atlantica TaxID=81569 RepID=A0A0P1EJN7_9RHOB|nr:helix-turn-helix domain-containing protein [Ruegeria atlantica]CUH42622.1 L-rhamnose operon regulatory protein RhaS [Ruegeria atlantica]
MDDPNDAALLTPWKLDYRQIEPGELGTRLKVVANGTISVTDIKMSHSVHQRGTPPPGTLTFGRVRDLDSFKWHGRRLMQPRLLSFGTVDGYESTSSGGFNGRVISLDVDYLDRTAQALGLEVPETIQSAHKFEAAGSVSEFNRLDSFVAMFLDDSTLLSEREMSEALAQEILLVATNGGAHEDKSTAFQRGRALRLALSKMEQFACDPLSIAEICKSVNCSWRTLDRAFKEEFGIGPKGYFIRFRLGRARKELLASDPAVSVINVANRWGFWRMGQFAADYKKMFGELPSTTLKRVSKSNW